MGLRFRKSVKVAPGVKLNINKGSIGVSAGVRGAHVSVNSKGTKTVSASLPGTGVSYVKTFGKSKSGKSKSSKNGKSGQTNIFKYIGIIFMIVLIAIAIGKAYAKKQAEAPAQTTGTTAGAEQSTTANGAQTTDTADQSSATGQTTAGDTTAATYILNTSSKKIHMPGCTYAASISADNYAESDKTLQELEAEGYKPCGTCFK